MSLSVKPKGQTFAIGGPVTRTYHPYSDKVLDAAIRADHRLHSVKAEIARNDRLKLKLRRARKVWR